MEAKCADESLRENKLWEKVDNMLTDRYCQTFYVSSKQPKLCLSFNGFNSEGTVIKKGGVIE